MKALLYMRLKRLPSFSGFSQIAHGAISIKVPRARRRCVTCPRYYYRKLLLFGLRKSVIVIIQLLPCYVTSTGSFGVLFSASILAKRLI